MRAEHEEEHVLRAVHALPYPTSLVPRGAPCADQAHEVTVPLDEDNEQDARCERLADDAGVLRVAFVLDDQSQRIGEDRRGLLALPARVSIALVGRLPLPSLAAADRKDYRLSFGPAELSVGHRATVVGGLHCVPARRTLAKSTAAILGARSDIRRTASP